jgi:hypothetical protein
MAAALNRKVDMRGLILQVAGIEEKPTANASKTLAAGYTKPLTAHDSGAIVLLDTAAGSTVTLPAGSSCAVGTTFTFVVSTLATSNSHKIQVANASDIMVGTMGTVDTDTSDAYAAFATTSTSDTITLNRSTTGSVRTGETITVTYVATNRWLVDGLVFVTGTPATPFSAAV